MRDPSPHATPHGLKRQPDDEIDHDQRLSKRFNLLNLEHNGKLYIPVKSESEATAQSSSPPRRRRSNAVTDSVPVDDSKDRVYIHNLDEEIADIESDEERLIFLPDIERHLMRIPKSVLMADASTRPSTDLVLYGVPDSLPVAGGKDAVRRAMAETRARAHAQAETQVATQNRAAGRPAASDRRTSGTHEDYDDANENAMDLG